MATQTEVMQEEGKRGVLETFLIFLRLGLTSFGGPVAHLGYFRNEFVERRKWLTDQAYADVVALCQFMPGPASSQVGLVIGLSRAGYGGAFAAWTGFTLPSALLLVLFAYGLDFFGDAAGGGWLRGVKIVAVVVVAHAVWSMAQSMCPDRLRGSLALLAAAISLTFPGAPGQIAAIIAGGLTGVFLLQSRVDVKNGEDIHVPMGKKVGAVFLSLFFIGLLMLPLLALQTESMIVKYADSFYRGGALVFGGGHVVLPLLNAETVGTGLVSAQDFIAGYGLAQAVPGPLFTFAAFLGSSMTNEPNGALGAVICLIAIFLPSVFLVFGVLPFWSSLKRRPKMRAALTGVNAVVVGLLLSALYNPVWTTGIKSTEDIVIALVIFGVLVLWKTPVWLVVAGAGAATGALTYAGML